MDALCKPVEDVSCEDLRWFHGIALGSPVYWGTLSGVMKTFLDNVQQRCFGWPVTELRWRVGAAFTTGAHLASGKDATLHAFHNFYLSVQMAIVGNEPAAACMYGTCATNRNESAPVPQYTDREKSDAASLAKRLVEMAKTMKPIMI